MTEDPVQIVIYVVGGACGMWLLIAASGALPAMAIWRGSLQEVPEEKAKQHLQTVLGTGQVSGHWAIEQSFEPESVLQLKSAVFSPIIVTWKHTEHNTYLCVYLLAGNAIAMDFVTVFAKDSILTTGNTRDAQMLPHPPSSWMQSFDSQNAAESWTHHQAALDHLKAAHAIAPSTHKTEFAEEFLAGLKAQQRHLNSLPLWVLRVPYWYFVRRTTQHNKSVAEQAA